MIQLTGSLIDGSASLPQVAPTNSPNAPGESLELLAGAH